MVEAMTNEATLDSHKAETETIVYTSYEEKTEQQMYQSMAKRMQAGGMDVTVAEIERLAETQRQEKKPKYNEDEKRILDKMYEYQEMFEGLDVAYVVRGALLRCDHGSHCRKLNLLQCHGVHTKKKPMMVKTDCKREENIPSFGVCSSSDNETPGKVRYLKDVRRDDSGDPISQEPDGTVTGTPCIPEIVGFWDETHDDTHVGKDGEPALTTRSFLVCKYNGLIEIVRSGQEDD